MNGKENNFNRVAFFYDFLARMVFGHELRNSQTVFLDRIPENSSLLILGGGTGWLLKELLKYKTVKRIVYVEVSSKMIAYAKRHLKPEEKMKVQFIKGNENCIKKKDSYDVIITFYILDLFKTARLNNIFNKLSGALKSNGLWLFADFNNKEDKNWWQKVLIFLMYKFFIITSNVEANRLPDFGQFFKKYFLKEIAKKTFYSEFIISKIYSK